MCECMNEYMNEYIYLLYRYIYTCFNVCLCAFKNACIFYGIGMNVRSYIRMFVYIYEGIYLPTFI